MAAPVVAGPFVGMTAVALGASNVKTAKWVPMEPITISAEASPLPKPGSIAHVARVDDIH